MPSCVIQIKAHAALLQGECHKTRITSMTLCHRFSPDAEETQLSLHGFAQFQDLLPLLLAVLPVPKLLQPSFQGKGINLNQQKQ